MEPTASGDHTLSLVRHSELDMPITIKIGALEGTLPSASLSSLLDQPELKHSGAAQPLPSDLYVVISLWADNKPLVPAVQTAHRSFKSRSSISWAESVTLPIKYRDLPLSAQLAITVYDIAGPLTKTVVGGSTLRLFGKKATLKKGNQRLFLWAGRHADGRVETETPSKVGLKDEMGRLEKLVKQHERGDITRMDWLDKLAFRQIEHVHASAAQKSTNLFLYVDLPRFDWPVVFSEVEYPLPMLASLTPATTLQTNPAAGATAPSPSFSSQASDAALFMVIDPEITRENPVEAKHRRLVRSHRSGPLDRELKPNAKIRDELSEIVAFPPTQELAAPQRDLLWQFRFYLTRDKRALTKFLKSVVWTDPGEVKQAVEVLLPMWAEVEMDDALELLGPSESFRDGRVRAYAVQQLGKVDDDELMLYLLQLVQALKFETTPVTTPSNSMRQSRHSSSRFAIAVDDSLPTLEGFLIERSARNPVLGNHFRWYIAVECEDKQRGKMFVQLAKKFNAKVAELHVEGEPDQLDLARRQQDFIQRISQLAKDLRASKDARPKKIERLKAVLSDSKAGLGSFAPIRLPLDAKVEVIGIDPDKSSVFKSNLFPLRLHLLTSEAPNASPPSSYAVIFKNGDDLRQDQLVIQLFTLMDRLLRKENLDLKLMPYRVLATGAVDGMVQFVASRTLQDISNEYAGGLLAYLREMHPDPGSVGTMGVKAEVMDTYVRSCAGYCVVTYLLGVGDRHLDNLLLSPDGHFFHVDFGYILGRDPKPFPPAVKVCKEMVDCMGGVNSPHYARFKSLCYTGFTTLRKNSNLIINLVALMVDGNIPDIRIEPDKAVGKVQDKFLLGGTEEEAVRVFEGLLNETSYFNTVLDRIHSVAQYWRA